MALAMREQVTLLTRSWRRRGHALGFGVGIAMGYATLGQIGFGDRHDYAAVGTVTNVAARLCDESDPGQILVGQRVHAAVEDLVAAEPVGELALRGFLRPVPAYNVLGFRGDTRPAPLSAREREVVLIALPKLNRALYRIADRLIDHRPLLARTIEVGTLPREAAEQFGVRGPLARASGIARDARADHRYAGYPHLAFKPITQDGGDVYARLVLLLLEAYESVKLIEQALKDLADRHSQGELPEELPAGQGASAVEGPHGLIRYVVESDGRRITRVRIDTPRQLDRLLARTLLSDALIDNAVAIIASTDPCTACAER
jgi:hypothetical protein